MARTRRMCCVLNNDIEATQDGWLDRLRSLAHRQEVGAVGALLMYSDKRVQHAGVVLGFQQFGRPRAAATGCVSGCEGAAQFRV